MDSAGLGPEINRDYIEGFIAAGGRRELKPVLELLFADSSQVTRQLVDDVLKYKRIDGVDAALRSIADQIFGGGQQHVLIGDRLAELQIPLLVVWGAEDRILPAEHARLVPPTAPRRRSCRAPGIRHTWRPRASSIEPEAPAGRVIAVENRTNAAHPRIRECNGVPN